MTSLPSAADLLATVLHGRVEINGHALNYDAQDALIWVTDPYGNDSRMLSPTVEACNNFLQVMASGGFYVLEP